MESDGGGKMRPKRNQTGNKPYDRKSSIFGRFSSSVKDLSQLLIPSWLAGESSDNKKSNDDHDQVSKDGHYSVESKRQHLVERVHSTSIAGSSLSSSSLESFTAGAYKQSHVKETASELRLSDSYLDDKEDPSSNIADVKSIMISTGSFNRSLSHSGDKRQKLWSPDYVRQGKPMTPPSSSKPAFNSILFGKIGQGDASLSDSFRESSFYSGKTRFGGASSDRKQLMNKSLPYQSSLPLRKQVRASKMNNSYQAVTSATAQRILETLDKMSTPLGDAKKIPQPETSESVLSFTPSSYRRTAFLGMSNRSVTRPLQLPKGPPTKPYQTAQTAEIRKNRYRPSEKDNQNSTISHSPEAEQEHKKTALFISEEPTIFQDETEMDVKNAASRTVSSGKMKTKKFSQHITSRVEDDKLMTMPTLRTDFTLPVSSINPISMPSFPVKANPKAINSIPMSSSHTDNSPVKFTFSTPIQKSQGARDSLNTNGKDFTFSSPIQASKICAAGAEEAPKWSPEPAVGASSVTAFSPNGPPVWGSTKAKPKSSPDIGGTSSSFKSYSKWGVDNSAAAESPGLLAPASSLKQGSVMDILGDYKGKSTTATSIPVSTTEDLLAKFRKPAGDWECDTCMIHNNANATKCLACETPKPSSKKTDISVPKDTSLTKVVELSDDLLSKFKPSGNWECDTCMLSNKPEADKCVACEAKRPAGTDSQVDKTNNNSLSAMFKKPEGNWECETCMVQNLESAIKCIACESSKPGLQSTNSASKPVNGPTSSIMKVNPGGGFSFNISTTATTQGSGGFKFGNSAMKSSNSDSKTSAVVTTATGFVFSQTSIDSIPSTNFDQISSVGFKFGSSTNNSTKVIELGATSSSSTTTPNSVATAGNRGIQGFQFGSSSITAVTEADKKSSENCSQNSSTFMKRDSVENSDNKKLTDSTATQGFKFSSTSNGPVSRVDLASTSEVSSISNKGPQSTAAVLPTFNFSNSTTKESVSSSFSFSSQTSVTNSSTQMRNKVVPGLFSFGTSQQTTPIPTTGLGMGKSLSDSTNSAPVINGGFGSMKEESSTDQTKAASGFGTSTPVFTFGQSTPSLPISTPSAVFSAQKRSVELNASSTSFGSMNSTVNSGGGFGGFVAPKAPIGAASAPSGGFGFGSSGPSFGQTPAPEPAATPAFGSSAGQTGGFSFSSTPDFNFGSSGSSQGSAPFQFGGNSNVNAASAPASAPAPSNMFQFNSTQSANVAPVFGGVASSGSVGNFSIGASSDTGRRPMKKAIRKLPRR